MSSVAGEAAPPPARGEIATSSPGTWLRREKRIRRPSAVHTGRVSAPGSHSMLPEGGPGTPADAPRAASVRARHPHMRATPDCELRAVRRPARCATRKHGPRGGRAVSRDDHRERPLAPEGDPGSVRRPLGLALHALASGQALRPSTCDRDGKDVQVVAVGPCKGEPPSVRRPRKVLRTALGNPVRSLAVGPDYPELILADRVADPGAVRRPERRPDLRPQARNEQTHGRTVAADRREPSEVVDKGKPTAVGRPRREGTLDERASPAAVGPRQPDPFAPRGPDTSPG